MSHPAELSIGGRFSVREAALWAAATSGDIPAITTLLKIMERRARYLSLDGLPEPETMHDFPSTLVPRARSISCTKNAVP